MRATLRAGGASDLCHAPIHSTTLYHNAGRAALRPFAALKPVQFLFESLNIFTMSLCGWTKKCVAEETEKK